MKKLIYCAAALAAMIFAGSCQQENLEPVAQENTVTYTVELPDVQTKAIGDASTVDQLIYEVWKTEAADERDLTNSTKATRLYQDESALVQRNGKTCAVITFNLVQDQEYTILFWAQKKGIGVYNTENLTDVHYAKGCEPGSSEYFSNQENYAAFYAADFVSDEDMKSRTIILKRPFAQLNIATKNTVEDYTVQLNSSRVVISSVATHFNVAQNRPGSPAVGTPVSFDFKTADVPTDPAKIEVNGQEYDYVAMNYVFANGTAIVSYEINTTLVSHSDQNTTTTAQIKNTVPSVPLQENYRTNIVGNLLTSTTEYYIEIDDSWYDEPGDGTEVEVWDGLYAQEPPMNDQGQYEVSLATHLAWIAESVNGTLVSSNDAVTKSAGYTRDSFVGKTFVLTQDIDLAMDTDSGPVPALWTPIGVKGNKPFEGTFDGKGFTIKNLYVDMDQVVANQRNIELTINPTDGAGLFGSCKNATIKNVNVENATVKGHYKAAVIAADANCSIIDNCHVLTATVLSTPYKKDDANNAGAIVGYLAGESGWAKVTRCSVEGAQVTAYRDVAAVVGRTNQKTEVSGNTVTNVQVVADQTPEYKEKKAGNAGKVVGYDVTANCVMENNVVDDATTAVVKVNTPENLQYQANNNPGTVEVVLAKNIKGNVVVDQKEGHNVIINGDGKNYDGTITIDGNSRNDGAETLVIKDVIFETTDPDVYFVEMNSKESHDRYAHNVTITNCTFKGNETSVGARFRQCYDIAFVGCTMTSGHSLAQLYGCSGVTFENVNVIAKGGISFGTSTNASVKNSTFNTTDYAVRADASVEATLNIEGITATAKYPVIARYYTNGGYKINLSGDNTLNAPGYQIVLTTGKDSEAFVAPATYSLNGADDFRVFPDSDPDAELFYAYDRESLQYILNNTVAGENIITFAADITGNVVVDQKEGHNVTIDGNGKKYDGNITIDGNSRSEGEETLLIKNVKFESEAESLYFLEMNSPDSEVRYAHNVKVQDCTFKGGEGVVGARFRQCYNIEFVGCTMTSGHSLAQLYGCTGVTIDGVNVTAKSGVSFGTTVGGVVKNSTFNVEKYGVRADATVATELKLEAVNIAGKLPVVARNYSNAGYKIILAGANTLTTPGYQVVLTTGDDEATFVAPAEYTPVSGAESFRVFPGSDVYYAYSTAEFKSLLEKQVSKIALMPGTYEGTFHVLNEKVITSANPVNKAMIKGRVHVNSVNATFNNVSFDRNETNSNEPNNTASNALQYKAVVMIYGDQTHTIKFDGCNFYNNNGTHKSAITNVACNLIVDGCYFEGYSSSIYSQANLSVTNSTFNYTGGNNVILSINGCGANGGKVIFKNNYIENKIFALSQFLSTVGFGNGTYHFDVQNNTGAGFDYYFLNTGKVVNKTFADGSETF